MIRRQRLDSDTNNFNSDFEAKALELRVSAIGVINSYNAENSTAEIQLVAKEGMIDKDGNVESKALPILPDVPIVFPHSKEHAITFPIKEGDECLVIFGDRAIDAWWQSGGVQEQNIDRIHSLSDAIAYVGPYSQKTKLGTGGSSQPHTDNLQVRSFDGKTFFEIESKDNNYNLNIKNDNSGNMKIQIMNGTLDIYCKGAMTIKSDTDIAIKAPHIGLND